MKKELENRQLKNQHLPDGLVLHRGIRAREFAKVELRAFADPWPPEFFSEGTHRRAWWLSQANRAIAFLYTQLVFGEAEILRIAVLPEKRRLGLAKILWQAFLQDTGDSLATVHLEVAQSNQAARSFYDRLGFAETGTRKHYYGRGDDALLMTWRREV